MDELEHYIRHIESITTAFNQSVTAYAPGIRMNPENLILSIKNKQAILPYESRFLKDVRGDSYGVIHATQMLTLKDCLEILTAKIPERIHAQGRAQNAATTFFWAPQGGGKTKAALAFQWLGPMIYLLSGQLKPYPIHVVFSSEEKKILSARLELFWQFYQHIVLETSVPNESQSGSAVLAFRNEPTLQGYRKFLLRRRCPDILFINASYRDVIRGTTIGKEAQKLISKYYNILCRFNFFPSFVFDDPDADPRLLSHVIADNLESEQSTKFTMLALSSRTEYMRSKEVNLLNVRIAPNYAGYGLKKKALNCLHVISLTQGALELNEPFLPYINTAAWMNELRFCQYAGLIGYEGSFRDYKIAAIEALHNAVNYFLNLHPRHTGVCIRINNTPELPDGLLKKFYHSEIANPHESLTAFGITVKQFVKSCRERRSVKPVIFVTDQSQLRESYPPSIRLYIDFCPGTKIDDLEKGLLGRAAGYGKSGVTVVLPDKQYEVFTKATKGAFSTR